MFISGRSSLGERNWKQTLNEESGLDKNIWSHQGRRGATPQELFSGIYVTCKRGFIRHRVETSTMFGQKAEIWNSEYMVSMSEVNHVMPLTTNEGTAWCQVISDTNTNRGPRPQMVTLVVTGQSPSIRSAGSKAISAKLDFLLNVH
jgi:hypothetical protein